MEYTFAPFEFQPICVFASELSYGQWIVGSCVLIHSANLCLLITEFNPFTCKIITDKEGLTFVIFLAVNFTLFLLCLVSFFVVKCLIPFSFPFVYIL